VQDRFDPRRPGEVDQIERGFCEARELIRRIEERARRQHSRKDWERIRRLKRRMAEWEQDGMAAGRMATQLEANDEQLRRLSAGMRRVQHQLHLRMEALREEIKQLAIGEST
jgi:hypothetical protein